MGESGSRNRNRNCNDATGTDRRGKIRIGQDGHGYWMEMLRDLAFAPHATICPRILLRFGLVG